MSVRKAASSRNKLRLWRVAVYIEPRDVWVGYFRGDHWHYLCLLPCLVIRWSRS